MCNDYERHIEWNAYCAAMAKAQLGMPAGAGPELLPQADDTRINDIAPIMQTRENLGKHPVRAAVAGVIRLLVS